jgi:hypothetical protein
MVEHEEMKKLCELYHWLYKEECRLLVLKQGGTYSSHEVECTENNCPIRGMICS